MAKFTVEDLEKVKARVEEERRLKPEGPTARVTVHTSTCGLASGAGEVLEAVQAEVAASGREDIEVTTSGCVGLCSHEPIVTVELLDQEPYRYTFVDAEKMREIFRRHVLGREVVGDYVLGRGTEHAA